MKRVEWNVFFMIQVDYGRLHYVTQYNNDEMMKWNKWDVSNVIFNAGRLWYGEIHGLTVSMCC